VQALLLSGARTDAADTDGRTVFFLAVTNGHADVVAILLEAGGAEVSTCGEWSRTALHVAAERGHVDVVALLLDHDARMYLETRDDMGYTALILAAGEGHLEVVRALLQCGADATAKNEDGYTGLHELAVAQHQSVKAASNGPELVKLFVNAGADVNALSGPRVQETALSLFLDFNRRERNGSFALALRAGGAVSTSELRERK
jgi:ankyrin repeat protein